MDVLQLLLAEGRELVIPGSGCCQYLTESICCPAAHIATGLADVCPRLLMCNITEMPLRAEVQRLP